MKTITTKIPNTHNKQDYMLLHIEDYEGFLEYLNELEYWIGDGSIEDWKHEVLHQLEGRRI